MRFSWAKIVIVSLLLWGCSSSSGINDDKQPDPVVAVQEKDYWPLAVGNTWQYNYAAVGIQTTPNGNVSVSESGTVTYNIVAVESTSDTTQKFTVEESRNISGYSTTYKYVIERTPTRIGAGLPRTGVADTLKIRQSHFADISPDYGVYVKGIGMIKEDWVISIHRTAGNQVEGNGSMRLTSYTLKP